MQSVTQPERNQSAISPCMQSETQPERNQSAISRTRMHSLALTSCSHLTTLR